LGTRTPLSVHYTLTASRPSTLQRVMFTDQAGGVVTDVDVTRGPGDACRTDARAVDARAAVVAGDQSAQVDRAVDADEAGSTAAQAGAVAGAAVTTGVIGEAVRRRAGAPNVLGRTRAPVPGHQVRAAAAVETWS